MRKILLIAVSVLILAAAGFWIYVMNIDWNQHKDKISAQISSLTGKRVVFDGPVELSFLPSPYLIASNVKVYNVSGDYGKKPLATVKSLIARVSFGAVFGDEWDVSRLSLVEPEIFFEIAADGSLNWQAGGGRHQLENRSVQIGLDSATLEKAKVHLIDAGNGIDAELDNLNAEVIAENLYGPYRIEGSYTRGDKPEGFAVSLGQFTENFATTLNLVVNYPSTESYVRFDGSFFLKDRTANGNIVFESGRVVDFLNEVWGIKNIDPVYNLPLAVTAGVAADKTRIDFSNAVVKFDNTTGAGNVLIPLAAEQNGQKPKVEIAFNMTDWNLQPAVNVIKMLVDGYTAEGSSYSKRLPTDFICDIQALKASYNNETLNNLALSFDWVGQKLTLRKMTGEMFGDTSFDVGGVFDASGEEVAYDFDVKFGTGEFAKLSEWLGYAPKQVAASTYKKAGGSAHIRGDLKNVQVSPFDFSLDNSLIKGEAGFIFGEKVKSMIVLNADSFNFDNYIEKLPPVDVEKGIVSRLVSRFRQLEALNALDVRMVLNLNLGIYNGAALENVSSDFTLSGGALNIAKLNIGTVWGSSVELSGVISGFGKEPAFQNLNYAVETNDASLLIKNLGIGEDVIKPGSLKKFSAKGTVSGSMTQADLNASVKAENLSVVYDGSVDGRNSRPAFNGTVEIKHPDFVKLVNNMGYAYKPKAFSLGLLQLKGKFAGDKDHFSVREADLNIGSNLFQGSFDYDQASGRKQVKTDVKVNRFEVERFMPEDNSSANNRSLFMDAKGDGAEFWRRPELSKVKIDYAPLNEFDLNGNFVFDALSYRDEKLSNVRFSVKMLAGVMTVDNFNADYNGGTVNGKIELAAGAEPNVRGSLKFSGQNLAGGKLAGSIYGLSSGELSGSADFNTSAVSFVDMIENLNGTLRFSVERPVVKGWNLSAVAEDLKERSRSEELAVFVQENLRKGETSFDTLNGSAVFAKGSYKAEDTVFAAPNVIVAMSGGGNVGSWSMDMNFDAEWGKLPGVPHLKFGMAGSMDAPRMTVDAGEIIGMLDAKEAQAIADQKAKEQARKDALQAAMDEQQERAKLIKQKINDVVLVRAAELEAKSASEKAKAGVTEIRVETDEDIQQIEKIFTLALTPEYDEELVNTAREMNDNLEKRVGAYDERMDSIYFDDVAGRVENDYAKLQQIHKNAEAMKAETGEKYKAYPQRLANIGSRRVLDNESIVVQFRSNIDDNLKKIKDIGGGVLGSYEAARNETDIAELEAYSAAIKNEAEKAQKELDAMSENVEKLYAFCEEIVSAEEEADRIVKEKEALQKKLEENTSTISVDGSGKVMKVVPDIEAVNKAEEAVRNEEVRVLDFSKKKDEGVVRQDNAPRLSKEVRQPSGIVRQISDDETVQSGGRVVKE